MPQIVVVGLPRNRVITSGKDWYSAVVLTAPGSSEGEG